MTDKSDKGVVVVEESASPLSLLQTGIAAGTVDSDAVKALTQLVQFADDREAKRAYMEAFDRFRTSCGTIIKTRSGGKGTYAPIEEIQAIIDPLLSDQQLSYRFSCEVVEGRTFTSCIMTHAGGHSETTLFPWADENIMPANAKGRSVVNQAQELGARQSYANRYALKAATGIRIAGEDDDAARRQTPAKLVSKEQAANIQALIDEVGDVDLAAFMRWAESDSIAKIAAHRYSDAVRMLEKKRGK